MNVKLFRKGDIAVIAVVAVVALLILLLRFTGDTENLTADITVDGVTVETVELSKVTERTEYRPETTPEVLIVAEDSAIYFSESNHYPNLLFELRKAFTH